MSKARKCDDAISPNCLFLQKYIVLQNKRIIMSLYVKVIMMHVVNANYSQIRLSRYPRFEKIRNSYSQIRILEKIRFLWIEDSILKDSRLRSYGCTIRKARIQNLHNTETCILYLDFSDLGSTKSESRIRKIRISNL